MIRGKAPVRVENLEEQDSNIVSDIMQADIRQVKEIIGEMPEDIDDDILEAIKQVDDSSTQEPQELTQEESANRFHAALEEVMRRADKGLELW